MKINLHLIYAVFIALFSNYSFAQTECLLDSVYQYNASNVATRKNIYTYNSENLRTESLTKDSVSGNWVNISRFLYTYNSAGKQIESISQNWVSNAWQNNERKTFTYNANNKVLTDRNELWDVVSSTWILHGFQKNYTYNIDDNVILYEQGYLNNGVSGDSVKHTYTYDGTGKETILLREGWSSSNPVWTPIQKFETVYNADNLIDSVYNSTWNSGLSSFNFAFLSTYSYNTSGQEIEFLNLGWSGSNWTPSSKKLKSYDFAGNQISDSSFYWLTASSSWRPTSVFLSAFNSDGLAESYTNLDYNGTLDDLVNSNRSLFSYNAEDYLTQMIFESWDLDNSLWNFNGRYVYFYDCDIILGFTDIANSIYNVFPNPTSNLITISSKKPSAAIITSGNGTILANLELGSETTVDVSTYSPGIYFIRTSEGQTLKFIKE